MLIAALFQEQKNYKQLNIQLTHYGMYLQFNHKNVVTCCNTNGPQKHHAKLKPDIVRPPIA